MKVATRERDGVYVIAPEGKITIGSGDTQLKSSIVEALESGSNKILLDMGKVTTLDSSGIGELVGAYHSVTNRGGKLKLLHLPSKISDLLQVTQLITVFEVYDTEEEAIASF
ncbi:MAG: STAS domain-containing protein [Acidobacteria bacterium]|nr:STAS domain-containing protein [Acidobacteriota bacterium]